MRRDAKVDDNQRLIVAGLRRAGVSVQVLSRVGEGCPDLACGHRGKTFMLEVKDPKRPPSGRKLTPDQETWHARWKGHVAVVETVEQALQAIGIGVCK